MEQSISYYANRPSIHSSLGRMPEWQYRYGDRSFTTKSPRSNIYSPIFIRSVPVHFPRFSTLPISRRQFVLKAHEEPPVVTQTRGAPFPRASLELDCPQRTLQTQTPQTHLTSLWTYVPLRRVQLCGPTVITSGKGTPSTKENWGGAAGLGRRSPRVHPIPRDPRVYTLVLTIRRGAFLP